MNKELQHIFGALTSEKHYVPNTISDIDSGRSALNVTAGQNANWTYANFFILDSDSPITGYSINEGQYVVAFRDGEWGLWDYKQSLVAKGLDEIEDFVKKVSDAERLRLNYLSGNEKKPVLFTPTILYGPPGTGKTHSLQHDYVDKFDAKSVEFCTFHQSFSYEDFVEGLKPILGDSDNVSYNIEKGVFYKACEKAAILAGYNSLQEAVKAPKEERKQKFGIAIAEQKLVLLCIDEINRGNVASIFGDLISLIEPSKRLGDKEELILTLPYSKERFGVPSNLMIVGTMNTADRSIQLLDSALRRRFRFEELPPVLEKIKYEPAKNVLRAINKRVRAVLNKDSQIGHAYFIDVNNDRETLDVMAKKVIPLLEEYFYNDIDKIRFVLNDYGDKVRFYLEDAETKEAYKHYTEVTDMDSEEKNFFYLNPVISGISGISEDLTKYGNYTASDFLNQIIGE